MKFKNIKKRDFRYMYISIYLFIYLATVESLLENLILSN
jgi:hypothetical protein